MLYCDRIYIPEGTDVKEANESHKFTVRAKWSDRL